MNYLTTHYNKRVRATEAVHGTAINETKDLWEMTPIEYLCHVYQKEQRFPSRLIRMLTSPTSFYAKDRTIHDQNIKAMEDLRNKNGLVVEQVCAIDPYKSDLDLAPAYTHVIFDMDKKRYLYYTGETLVLEVDECFVRGGTEVDHAVLTKLKPYIGIFQMTLTRRTDTYNPKVDYICLAVHPGHLEAEFTVLVNNTSKHNPDEAAEASITLEYYLRRWMMLAYQSITTVEERFVLTQYFHLLEGIVYPVLFPVLGLSPTPRLVMLDPLHPERPIGYYLLNLERDYLIANELYRRIVERGIIV